MDNENPNNGAPEFPNERMVRAVVRKFINCGIAEDDLFQEGMLALLKAQRTYSDQKGVKFETYAGVIIRNRIIDIIRASHIYEEQSDDNSQTQLTGETLEHEVDILEKSRLLQNILNTKCTEIERAIFNAYYSGYDYKEISKIFEITNKKIDNTVQKIKRLAANENK
jgi:RNA polymerase sigma factor (sigma-70 family)